MILKIKWWTFRKALLEHTLFDFDNLKITTVVFPEFFRGWHRIAYTGSMSITRPKKPKTGDEYYYVDTGKTLFYKYIANKGLYFWIVYNTNRYDTYRYDNYLTDERMIYYHYQI